jgi:hypothetical protein
MSPTSIWCCPTTLPVSTTRRTTSPRKRGPHGKPPSAGTTSTQSSGSPKFERSEQQRQRIQRPHLLPGSSAPLSTTRLDGSGAPNGQFRARVLRRVRPVSLQPLPRAGRPNRALLCGALLGACRDAGAPDGERMFGVTPVPSVVRLASAVVTLVPFDTPVGATAGRVISRSLQPAVATVDTTGSAAPSPIGWRNARMCPRRSRTRRWRTVSPTLSRLPIGAQTFSNDAGC